jgi:iron-sulfur cluster assembly protein
MIEVTESAASAIKEAMVGSSEPILGLRIMVQPGGCAGMKYSMGLIREAIDGDLVFDSSGLRLFVDKDSLELLEGVRLDFVEGSEGAGFSFENPNATSQCACGKSFC